MDWWVAPLPLAVVILVTGDAAATAGAPPGILSEGEEAVSNAADYPLSTSAALSLAVHPHAPMPIQNPLQPLQAPMVSHFHWNPAPPLQGHPRAFSGQSSPFFWELSVSLFLHATAQLVFLLLFPCFVLVLRCTLELLAATFHLPSWPLTARQRHSRKKFDPYSWKVRRRDQQIGEKVWTWRWKACKLPFWPLSYPGLPARGTAGRRTWRWQHRLEIAPRTAC